MSQCLSYSNGECTNAEAQALVGLYPSQGVCSACPFYSGPLRGAGDIVHAVAKATGIARAVGDCGGCAARRAALNRLLPMPDTHTED